GAKGVGRRGKLVGVPRRTVALIDELGRRRPDLPDPEALIAAALVLVDGRFVTNPASRVAPDCSIVVRDAASLRGEAKLGPALSRFGVAVEGRVALDAGAAAGGFTRVLLDAGLVRV